MILKPLDLLVCLKLVTMKGAPWTYASLADSLDLSASVANAAVKRSLAASLLTPPSEPDGKPNPATGGLLEFLEHGVRYAFPESPGRTQRGMPTAHSAPPLDSAISSDENSVLVWPDPEGNVRGQTFLPLYRTAPAAARRDPALYELLSLVDALRDGRLRERRIAVRLLAERMH